MKESNLGWGIEKISTYSYLAKASSEEIDGQCTILKNARRQENEIIEIAHAIGTENVKDIVTLTPRRLAFYESIITIETEAKLKHEDDLKEAVHKTYKDHVVKSLKEKINDLGKTKEAILLEQVDHQISTKVNTAFSIFKAQNSARIELGSTNTRVENSDTQSQADLEYLNEIRETYNKINKRIKDGSYIPGQYSFEDDHESITKKAVYDKFYNKIMPKKIEELVNPLVSKLLEDKLISCSSINSKEEYFLEKLTTHQGNERHTFMILGAPASGKGVAMGISQIKARRLNIDYADMAKIRTDVHRNLVSNPMELGQNIINHSAFNYDESSLLTAMVCNRIRAKFQARSAPHLYIEGDVLEHDKTAPHLYIEGVGLDQNRIDLATMDNGQLHIDCMTVRPEISVERAFLRGKSTGRYVGTKNILRAHRELGQNFHQSIVDNQDRKIEFTLWDNNNDLSKMPTVIEQGFTHEIEANGNITDVPCKQIIIHDKSKLDQFMDNKNININATRATDIYLNNIATDNYVAKIRTSGFEVDMEIKPTEIVEVEKSLPITNKVKTKKKLPMDIATKIRRALERKKVPQDIQIHSRVNSKAKGLSV